MAKHPEDPKTIFPEIIADYQALFADDLVSIILYGSAAGDAYRPGKSDINFIIVLTEAGMERLDRAFACVRRWQKRRVTTPLFLTEDYIKTSLDVYPIEYLNFQRNHVRVFGKDILKDLTFDTEHIRLQCEREVKGKLLLLREAFLDTLGKGRALKKVIGPSLSAFIAIFEALLYLKGVKTPEGRGAIIQAAGEALGRDAGLFQKLLDIQEGRITPGNEEILDLFRDYLREVQALSKQVDQLGG